MNPTLENQGHGYARARIIPRAQPTANIPGCVSWAKSRALANMGQSSALQRFLQDHAGMQARQVFTFAVDVITVEERGPIGMSYAEAMEFAKESAKRFGVGPTRHFTYDEGRVRAKLEGVSAKKAKAVKA